MVGLRRAVPIALLTLALLGLRQLGPAPLQLAPLLESVQVHPGTMVRALLRVQIPAGLKLQANQPRDPSLIPTVLSFDAVPGVTVTETVFPDTTEVELPGYAEPLVVYAGDLVIGVTFELDADVPPGDLVIPGHLQYQACDDRQCFIPRTIDTAWTLQVVPPTQPIARGADDARSFATIAFGTGEPPPVTAAEAAAAIAPPAPEAVGAPPASVVDLFDEFTIRSPAGSYMGEDEFVQFVENAEAGVQPAGFFDDKGPIAILALVFIGGLALNLTPCVLPMIPINLMIIGAGAQGRSRGRGFLLGSAYGAAMAAVYGVLGLAVVLTAGTFGTINASPWFNLGIAGLFVVLALAMFDVISIDFSRFSSRIQFSQQSRGTVMLAFGMGAVAALLAGACVAPVVIQVVVFASDQYASGSGVALALPFVLGLGMACPWPLAGAGFSALPKPGAWMVQVKQVMGVFILAMAAYYAYVGYGILSARWVDPAKVAAGVEEMLEAGWHASLAEGLETAKREGTPVLVDFWATWCKNCLVMDQTTMKSAAVQAALDGYTKIKVQAEDPEAPPYRELMHRIGAIGLPAYVILEPPR
jgi:cytochrome c biogenesis protein CcdA